MRIFPYSRIDTFFCCLILLLVAVLMWIKHDSRIVFNGTDSMPLGFYYKTGQCCHAGDIVLVSVRKLSKHSEEVRQALERRYFKRNSNLLKRIIAEPGDTVSIDTYGIIVNDTTLANSKPLTEDGNGKPMNFKQISDYKLEFGEYVIKGDHPKSFDSRYFGIVPIDNIIDTVIPLFTF